MNMSKKLKKINLTKDADKFNPFDTASFKNVLKEVL